MASPMKRTIQTCQLGFAPEVEKGMKILLMPLAQESSDEPMDTGSEVEDIMEMFGDIVDPQRIELFPYWNRNVGVFDTTASALIDRARKLRNVLRQRPEKNIVLVTHGAFAHSITGNIDLEGEQTTRMWENAECRTFRFVGDGQDEDAQLVETDESKGRRPSLAKQTSGYILNTAGVRKSSLGDIMEAKPAKGSTVSA